MRAPVPEQQPTPEDPAAEQQPEEQPAPMEEEQAVLEEQPAPEEPAPEEDSDEEDSDNWSPATTDEDQDLMPARGPVQAALVASFKQHRGLSVEEINAALEQRGVRISLQRHELEERARVTMQEEREALRQFYRETAEGRLAREAREATEAAAAEAVAAAEAARNARMSMDRLRRRTVMAERHHQMVAARQARRAAAMAVARATANDAEAGPSCRRGPGPHAGWPLQRR